MLATLLALLTFAAPAPPPPAGAVFTDEEPPAAWHSGPSSARLGSAVVIRFDEKLVDQVPVTASQGGTAAGTSDAVTVALRRFGPAVARRHFEDARWTTEAGKGRELVLKSVGISFTQGPSYQVQVVVERVLDGKRIGQATGQGSGFANHQGDRTRAAWAGPWAAKAANAAASPHLPEDAQVLAQAGVMALDSALLQLGAIWSAEDQRDAMLKAAQQQQAKPPPAKR